MCESACWLDFFFLHSFSLSKDLVFRIFKEDCVTNVEAGHAHESGMAFEWTIVVIGDD